MRNFIVLLAFILCASCVKDSIESVSTRWTRPPKVFIPRNDLIPGDLRWYESLGFEHIASFACYLGEDYVNLYGEPDISAFR